MNYEAIRTVVADAVMRAIPVSPDDHDCVVQFREVDPVHSPGVWSPLWGPPEQLVEMITTEVMQALYPAPVSLPDGERLEGDPRTTGRWTCGCDSSKCDIKWVVGRDASTDPSQVIKASCLTHGLVGRSQSARCADNPALRQQAQALMQLDQAHGEQCR